jgi:hypothetical protein
MRNRPRRGEPEFMTQRYRPHPLLRRYMWEKSHIEKKKLKAMAGEGKVLTQKEKKRLEGIRTDKKRIIENIIFPSMANVLFFFESISQEPTLNETFKEDRNLEDILGIRRHSPSFDNYGIFFVRLLRSILYGGMIGYDKDDFRLRLMHEAHRVINSMVTSKLPFAFQRMRPEYSDYSITESREAMRRALAWTEIMSKDVADPYPFSNLFEEGDREKFIKHAKIEAPNRTLDVQTQQILNGVYY